MRKKSFGKSLQKDINRYKKLRRSTPSIDRYYEMDTLSCKAHNLLNLYEDRKIRVPEKYHKIFASYIQTFADEKQAEKLFDKLQKRASFDVRQYALEASRSFMDKLLGRYPDRPKYLSAKQLNKKANAYILYSKKLEKNALMGININKYKKLSDEAFEYIAACAKRKIDIKPEDADALQHYIHVILGHSIHSKDVTNVLNQVSELNQQQNLQPTEQKISFKQKMANAFSRFKAFISPKKEEKKTAPKLAPSFSLKRLWDKTKAASLATLIAAGSILGLKSSSNSQTTTISMAKQPVEKVTTAKTSAQTEATPRFIWNSVAAQPAENMFSLDSLRSRLAAAHAEKIKKQVSANKKNVSVAQSAPTNTHQKIWNNYYDNTIEILSSKQKKEQLYRQIDEQIEKGIFSLPQNISKERLAYTYLIYQEYGVHSSLKQALSGNEKLTELQQKQLIADINAAGEKGNGVKQMAQKKHGKLSSFSHYDNASKDVQKQHVKNLKELRQLRKMQSRVNTAN